MNTSSSADSSSENSSLVQRISSILFANSATVSLNIYDVAGKLVRTLIAADSRGAGSHEVQWQGRDEAGQVVAAGIYFYRLEAGAYSDTRRMTLVK